MLTLEPNQDGIVEYPKAVLGNQGPVPGSFLFVAGEGADAPDLVPEGHDWSDEFVKCAEAQSWRATDLTYVDDYGCVVHSAENECECQKEVQGSPEDMDDRWLVVASGTVPRKGNSGEAVAECLRLRGCPLETEVPSPEGQTESDYYALKVEDYASQAARHNERWLVRHTWIDMEDPAAVAAALRKGPIQVYVPSLGYDAASGQWYRAGTEIIHAVNMLTNMHLGPWKLGDSYRSNGSFVKVMRAGTKVSRWGKLITVRKIGNMNKDQYTADFCSRNDKRLGRCPETGARYLVSGGAVRHISQERAGFAALACLDYGIGKESRVDIPSAELDKLNVVEF